MKIERDERRFDFHDIGLAIKRAREASGMTQEQLAYIVDRAPRTIIYNIVDSRYRSRKPLIVTTNLTLDEIRHPQDTAHARIFDRLLEMCVPVSCIGVSLRKENAQKKLERLKILIG